MCYKPLVQLAYQARKVAIIPNWNIHYLMETKVSDKGQTQYHCPMRLS